MRLRFQILVILTSFTLISCHKDDPISTSIIGEWVWIQSYTPGGIPITPQTEGYTFSMIIDDNYITEYKNDTFNVKTKYSLEKKENSMQEIKDFIIYENGYDVEVQIVGKELEITDEHFTPVAILKYRRN